MAMRSIWLAGVGGAALFTTVLGFSGQSYAAPCATTDVSLTINGTAYVPTACADSVAQGGGPTSETTSLNTQLGHAGFVYLDSSDDAGTPTGLGGIQFTVTATTGNSGTWTVTWTDTSGLPNLPYQIDLEVGLFGGN